MPINPNQFNLITILRHLLSHIRYVGGENKNDLIYLSILGEVYDVTAGHEFYGPNAGGYSFFAGRDASICFFTGEYTEEHLNEKKVIDIETHEIFAIEDWRAFYETHDDYKFLGVLEGDYYDKEGKATPYLMEIREKIDIGRKEEEEKQRKRKEEQAKRRAERLAREAAEKEKEKSEKDAKSSDEL